MAFDPALRNLLVELIQEIQDLRASSIVLAQQVGTGVNPVVAASRKANALADLQPHYAALLEKVNAI